MLSTMELILNMNVSGQFYDALPPCTIAFFGIYKFLIDKRYCLQLKNKEKKRKKKEAEMLGDKVRCLETR